MSGLSAAGFDRKRLVDIKADIENALKVQFGDNIDLAPQSVFGQIIGIISEAISDQWESQENVYNSQYPSTAQGNQLSNVVQYNGIERQGATFSTVTGTITGVSGTVIPAGSLASVVGTGDIFVTNSEVTINGSAAEVPMTAQNNGPIAAVAGTLTQIESPIFGWTGITNNADAVVGSDEETDAELRERRELSTAALGQNLVDSLFGQVINLDWVNDALVISNGENTTSPPPESIPPHQFLTVVDPDPGTGSEDEAELAQIIWNNTPQGILSFGSVTTQVVDAQGFLQDVKYSVVAEIDIYFKIDLTVDPNIIPPSEEATVALNIQNAVASYGTANFGIGDDVIRVQFYTPINETDGILTADLFIGTTPSPTGTTNITISSVEVSRYSATNVEVNFV